MFHFKQQSCWQHVNARKPLNCSKTKIGEGGGNEKWDSEREPCLAWISIKTNTHFFPKNNWKPRSTSADEQSWLLEKRQNGERSTRSLNLYRCRPSKGKNSITFSIFGDYFVGNIMFAILKRKEALGQDRIPGDLSCKQDNMHAFPACLLVSSSLRPSSISTECMQHCQLFVCLVQRFDDWWMWGKPKVWGFQSITDWATF